MPFTSAKGLSVQSLNANVGTWGVGATDSLNTGCFQPLDNMLGGITTLSLSSTTPQLLTQTQAQNALLRITGALLANIVISPDTGVLMQGFYYFENLTTNSFSVTFTNSVGSVVLPQGRRGVLWIDTTNGPRVMSSIGSGQTDIIPVGSVAPFYNTSAPTGWTATSLDDYALKVVSSSGGVTSGSVTYSTLFSRIQTDAYALQIADIPPHTHSYSTDSAVASTAAGSNFNSNIGSSAVNTGSTGGGSGHYHGLDMRVRTAAVILCRRS